MIENLRKRYADLQGLLNTPIGQSQGGLLGKIPQGALLGSAIYGQGVQGKDPFASLLPAFAQTAQIQKLITPKDTRTAMGKNLEEAGFVRGTPEYQEAMKLRTLPEGTVGFSSFQKKANVDKANINANYAIEGIDLLTSVANIGAKSPNTFGLKGGALGLAKDISTEVEGIYKGSTRKAADKGGIASSAYDFLGDPNFAGIQPLENALAIHIARNRNPSGRLMKDMIADAKGDASLQGLGGAEKVAQRLPFIFKEFIDTATNQYKAAGKSDGEIAKILNPKIIEFNESLNVLTGAVKPKIIPKDNMPKEGKDGIWRF